LPLGKVAQERSWQAGKIFRRERLQLPDHLGVSGIRLGRRALHVFQEYIELTCHSRRPQKRQQTDEFGAHAFRPGCDILHQALGLKQRPTGPAMASR
jgi:hypothetical protein